MTRPPRRQIAMMNVVPYVDVMLVLLVIFMVTAPFIQTEQVDLPRVGPANQQGTATIEITVRQNGALMMRDFNARKDPIPMTVNQIAKFIQTAQSRNARQNVVIAADRDVRYEEVMKVMFQLRQAQVDNIGLLVQPPSR